jgi:NAD(P)-dependent dehydrogenase (short-subunit alcohol dehydrogenase family)
MSTALPKLYLARHGDTAGTDSHRHTGRTDLLKASRGSVVNVSSVGGSRVLPDRVAYGTSKAALDYLARPSFASLCLKGSSGPQDVSGDSVSEFRQHPS